MLASLATHFDSTEGAIPVPGYTPNGRDNFPYGAIGLAAAAVRTSFITACCFSLNMQTGGSRLYPLGLGSGRLER